MKNLSHGATSEGNGIFLAPQASTPLALPGMLGPEGSNLLQRMFQDPRVLEPEERKDLIAQLKSAVELAPQAADIRVLLGMALCVDLQVHPAMEEMREAVKIAPDSFIARFKFGELLMRLRICDQAAEHTQEAARLASNPIQADMARKQAATLRTMQREGIQRGGYAQLIPRILPFRRKAATQETSPVLVGSK